MWTVQDTPCWPNRWKLVHQDPPMVQPNNPSNFFADREKAEKEAGRRNVSEKETDGLPL